jgi:hypothetical protein
LIPTSEKPSLSMSLRRPGLRARPCGKPSSGYWTATVNLLLDRTGNRPSSYPLRASEPEPKQQTDRRIGGQNGQSRSHRASVIPWFDGRLPPGLLQSLSVGPYGDQQRRHGSSSKHRIAVGLLRYHRASPAPDSLHYVRQGHPGLAVCQIYRWPVRTSTSILSCQFRLRRREVSVLFSELFGRCLLAGSMQGYCECHLSAIAEPGCRDGTASAANVLPTAN